MGRFLSDNPTIEEVHAARVCYARLAMRELDQDDDGDSELDAGQTCDTRVTFRRQVVEPRIRLWQEYYAGLGIFQEQQP